jgi:hypothetical protein
METTILKIQTRENCYYTGARRADKLPENFQWAAQTMGWPWMFGL